MGFLFFLSEALLFSWAQLTQVHFITPMETSRGDLGRKEGPYDVVSDYYCEQSLFFKN